MVVCPLMKVHDLLQWCNTLHKKKRSYATRRWLYVGLVVHIKKFKVCMNLRHERQMFVHCHVQGQTFPALWLVSVLKFLVSLFGKQ
jgi:hypothetical protein